MNTPFLLQSIMSFFTALALIVGAYIFAPHLYMLGVVAIWAGMAVVVCVPVGFVVGVGLLAFDRWGDYKVKMATARLDHAREMTNHYQNEYKLMTIQQRYANQIMTSHGKALLNQKRLASLPAPQPVIEVQKKSKANLKDFIVSDNKVMGFCAIIKGGKGSGKSTLMRHIAELNMSLYDHIIVLDPHNKRGSWSGLPVFGGGRNFDDCVTVLELLVNYMTLCAERSNLIEGYELPFRLLVQIDEYRALIQNYDNKRRKYVGGLISKILTEGRKYGIDIVMGTHSLSVRSLGWDGEKLAILENMDVIIYLSRNKYSDTHYASVDITNNGEVERIQCEPLGKFYGKFDAMSPCPILDGVKSISDNDKTSQADIDRLLAKGIMPVARQPSLL